MCVSLSEPIWVFSIPILKIYNFIFTEQVFFIKNKRFLAKSYKVGFWKSEGQILDFRARKLDFRMRRIDLVQNTKYKVQFRMLEIWIHPGIKAEEHQAEYQGEQRAQVKSRTQLVDPQAKEDLQEKPEQVKLHPPAFHVPDAHTGYKTGRHQDPVQGRHQGAQLFDLGGEYLRKSQHYRQVADHADDGYDLWPLQLLRMASTGSSCEAP